MDRNNGRAAILLNLYWFFHNFSPLVIRAQQLSLNVTLMTSIKPTKSQVNNLTFLLSQKWCE